MRGISESSNASAHAAFPASTDTSTSSNEKKQLPSDESNDVAFKAISANAANLLPIRKIASEPPGKLKTNKSFNKINTSTENAPHSRKNKKANEPATTTERQAQNKNEKDYETDEDATDSPAEALMDSSIPSFPSSPNDEKKEIRNSVSEHKRSLNSRLPSPQLQHPHLIEHHPAPDHVNLHCQHDQKNVLVIPLPPFLHDNHSRHPEGQQPAPPAGNFTFSTSYSCSSSSTSSQQRYDTDQGVSNTNKTALLIGALTVSMIISKLFLKVFFPDNHRKP